MAATRGQRNPALLLPVRAPVESDETPVYKVGNRPIRVGDAVLQPGEVVEGAHEWLRLESRLRARTLVRA